MKAIQIKKTVTVYDQMGHEYQGAFVPFFFPIQQNGGGQQQNTYPQGTLEEIAGRESYTIQYFAYRSQQDSSQNPQARFPLYSSQGTPVGQLVLQLDKDEQKEFSLALLNQKMLEKFETIFGKENVELIDE